MSSEDEEDELIFSDELHERGSDTDSDPEDNRPLPKISLKASVHVLSKIFSLCANTGI